MALFVPSQTFVHVLNHLTMYTAELEILVAVVNVLVLLELVLRIAAYGKARHAAVTLPRPTAVGTPPGGGERCWGRSPVGGYLRRAGAAHLSLSVWVLVSLPSINSSQAFWDSCANVADAVVIAVCIVRSDGRGC